jgi:hypothetical protein
MQVLNIMRVLDMHVQNLRSSGWLTFRSHSFAQALVVSAVLTLVAVMLVHRAVPVAAALVAQLPADGPLEETLAA